MTNGDEIDRRLSYRDRTFRLNFGGRHSSNPIRRFKPKSMKTRTIFAATLLVCAALVSAQGGQGGQDGRQGRRGAGMFGQAGRGFGEMQLVFRTDVQADLGLTAEQKTKLTELQNKQRQSRRGSGAVGTGGSGTSGAGTAGGGGVGSSGRRGNRGGAGQNMTDAEREAMRKRMEEQRAQTQKDLAAILTEAQVKRLGEIRFQLQGARAVLNPENQKTLALTTEQVTRISDLQQKQQQANQALTEKVRNQQITREELQKSRENNEKIFDAELLKILTPDQSAKLKEMGGKPFKADPTARRGGGR
jgi:Spy/CpxP family protein refolding chaperone